MQKGFTIVELLIGVASASILALTAGAILVNAYQGWVRSLAMADMERDAAVAVHVIALAVRGASNAVPGEVGTDKLKVVIPPNSIVRAFSVQTSGGQRSLVYNPNWPNGASMVLVNGRLGTFQASVTAGVVRVTISLSGIDQNSVDTGVTMVVSNMTICMRN